MKGRWIFVGVAIGIVLSLSLGFAFADRSAAPTGGMGSMFATCNAMHESPAMERMHAQMPAAWRAQCDAMHAQMGQMMGGAGRMGPTMMTDGGPGGGMMTGGMRSGGMWAHHFGR